MWEEDVVCTWEGEGVWEEDVCMWGGEGHGEEGDVDLE